jgi:chorismate mutase
MANSFVNKKVDLTGVSATTLYTIPTATTAVIRSILVSDDSGSGDTITVTITAGSDVFSLFKVKTIGANATVELLTGPLVVQESEVLKVTAATANRLHVVLSALEIKPRIVTT